MMYQKLFTVIYSRLGNRNGHILFAAPIWAVNEYFQPSL